MADFAHTTPASAVHLLAGSSAPGAGRPNFKPATAPKPRPQASSMGLADVSDEPEVIDLAKKIVALLRREADILRHLDMLKLHSLRADQQHRLFKRLARIVCRIDRTVTALAKTRSPTLRAVAMKGEAAIGLKIGRVDRTGDIVALGLSLAHDAAHLGLEQACLPQIPDGNFCGYHSEILRLHAQMKNAATDDEADPLMVRWGDIDRMAMADRPKSFDDAIGALQYARREHHQFNIEAHELAGETPCPGDRLIEHLIDGAISVLQRVEKGDAETPKSPKQDSQVTICEMADLDFEPLDFQGWIPPTNVEWAKLADPYLVTSRIAFSVCQKTKSELVDMVRTVGDPEAGNLSERLLDAESFFDHLRNMIDGAETRLLSAACVVLREQGVPEAQPSYARPGPARATEAA